MSIHNPVQFQVDEGVARLILYRPERGNAIDLSMAKKLEELAAECDTNSAIRCVVISGEGKLFCGGGDVNDFAAAGQEASQLIESITSHLHSAIATFARMAKPLVTVINGPAAGAGVALASLGDVAIASETAHFTLAYSSLGLTPDAGTTWLLPRLIGLRRTQELLLTNRRLSAEEAAEAGLVTRAVDHARLWQEANPIISALASGPAEAIGATRALLLSSSNAALKTQLKDEARSIAVAVATAESQRRISAFAAMRRKPG